MYKDRLGVSLSSQSPRVDVALGTPAGIDNRGHPVLKSIGAVAGDAECYQVFACQGGPKKLQHACSVQTCYPVSFEAALRQIDCRSSWEGRSQCYKGVYWDNAKEN